MQVYQYPSEAALARESQIRSRGLTYREEEEAAVARILREVQDRKDAAVLSYTRSYDAPEMTPEGLMVTEKEFREAEAHVSGPFKQALSRAAAQIRSFHQRQVQNSWISTDRPGTFLGQLVNPVGSAAVYVPGGKGGDTPLVSSVLMGGIPAKIAGVPRVVMATPPKRDGSVDPHLLVAAKTVGIDAVYKMGSAWAIAALAYGTETVTPCDVIVGPGNIYVAIAKKLVSGTVGIDMIAGPSEVLVIADDTAVPEFTAADLLSQAEHDPMASAILVTPYLALAEKVVNAIRIQLERLSRKEIAAASLEKYGAAMVVADLDSAIDLSNRIAPEHLELQIANPLEVIGRIRNAGAVFLGNHTPEPVGDYIAGPNHVLPTAGTARFSSALSVDHFIKKTSVLQYSRGAFEAEAADIITLAQIEGLDAHAQTIRIRLGGGS
jgi:histidinol dehydrogenase